MLYSYILPHCMDNTRSEVPIPVLFFWHFCDDMITTAAQHYYFMSVWAPMSCNNVDQMLRPRKIYFYDSNAAFFFFWCVCVFAPPAPHTYRANDKRLPKKKNSRNLHRHTTHTHKYIATCTTIYILQTCPNINWTNWSSHSRCLYRNRTKTWKISTKWNERIYNRIKKKNEFILLLSYEEWLVQPIKYRNWVEIWFSVCCIRRFMWTMLLYRAPIVPIYFES